MHHHEGQALNADILICPRSAASVSHPEFGDIPTTGAADPTVAVFKNLVQSHGSIPFSVQVAHTHGLTDGLTDGRTYGRTDRQTDGLTD